MSLAGAHRLVTGHPTATVEVQRNCSYRLPPPTGAVRGCSRGVSVVFDRLVISIERHKALRTIELVLASGIRACNSCVSNKQARRRL